MDFFEMSVQRGVWNGRFEGVSLEVMKRCTRHGMAVLMQGTLVFEPYGRSSIARLGNL